MRHGSRTAQLITLTFQSVHPGRLGVLAGVPAQTMCTASPASGNPAR
jgi:hypothetical protein